MKTKYPIILVHGIIIKDIGLVKSFGKIDSILKQRGYRVYKSKIDSFGTIEDNALILKNEIDKIIDKTGCQKVNIIAHSKGGLDAKYMLKNYEMNEKVASLTTLCTPHKGSPIAKAILRSPRWVLLIIAFIINFFYKLFGDRKPNSLKVCEQLAVINDFDDKEISNKVYCQSYSAKMNSSKDEFVMGIPYAFFNYFNTGVQNDGLVSIESAEFGRYKGEAIHDSISHSEIVDFLTRRSKKNKIYSFYFDICEDLSDMGF